MLGKEEILFSLWFLHYQFNEGNSKIKKDRQSAGQCLVTATRTGILGIKRVKSFSQWKIRILENKEYHFHICS
jgi:hypothetical protein